MQLRQQSRQTPAANNKNPIAFAPRLCAQGPHENQLSLYSSGNAEPLSKSERAALLAQLKAGEHVELEFEAITFIQRDTPNRNFVRFQPGTLPSLAKSFAGVPFLMNHDSYDVASRGGTVLDSKLEHNEDGSKQMRMRVKAVKAWAVEGLLDGTIDRFSISWDRGGVPLQCSIHLAGWYECSCRLGAKLEDGRVAELLVTGSPVGTEMSGVNVPAVVGTHVGSISELSAIDDPALLADILGRDTTSSGEMQMDPKTRKLMCTALGLAETATDEQLADAAQANADKLTIAETASKNTSERLAAIEAENAKRAKAEREAAINVAISSLTAHGKIKPGSEVEGALRRIGEKDLDLLGAHVKELLAGPSVTPVGAQLPAAKADPQPSGGPEGKTFLSANPAVATWLSKAGISEADFEKHGKTAREMHEAIIASR